MPKAVLDYAGGAPGEPGAVRRGPKKPARRHIHCVVRTPNGNDYGEDLLSIMCRIRTPVRRVTKLH